MTEKISRREWGIAAGLALAVTLALQLPYALGYWTTRVGTEYSGLLVNLSDVTYYVAIQLGMQGEWLYRIRFTAESHAGAFLYTFYLALGYAARALGMDAMPMWHVSRATSSFLMFLGVYGFNAYFVDKSNWRLWSCSRLTWVLMAGQIGSSKPMSCTRKGVGRQIILRSLGPNSFIAIILFCSPRLKRGRLCV
jgi:hypothetical protein